MKSIYGSKLYLASKRKDRIQAALTCLGNMELVQQLADDLDEEYKVPENLGLDESESEPEANDLTEDIDVAKADVDNFSAFEVDEEVNPQTDLVSVNDIMTQDSSEASSASQEDEEQELDKEASEQASPTKHEPVPQPAAIELAKDKAPQLESSIQLVSTNDITAATQVVIEDRPQINLTVLKSTLNSRADTAGVSRVSMKENELWIYYNDSTNLNNVMTEVIECLASEEYKQFEFNRLARSDNAVVFERKNEA